MAIPLYGQNADGDNLQYSADGKTGSKITWGDEDKTLEPGDLAGVKTFVYTTAATTSGTKTCYLPDAGKCDSKEVEFHFSVASDAQASAISTAAGGAFVGGIGVIKADDTHPGTIIQSNGSNTVLTLNDNIEPGGWIKVWSNGTNWYVSGFFMSADATAAFS